MKTVHPRRRAVIAATTALFLALPASWAAGLPPDVQVRVEQAKKRLVEMAADPVIIASVRDANGRDNGGMNNGKWIDLTDSDPAVKTMLSSKASKMIMKWEADDQSINKILLRDQKGNIVAGSTKPLIYNNATRPVFAIPSKGQPWAADEIKPDTTTQIPSVHVAAPVLDGGKTIGVIHAGVTAK